MRRVVLRTLVALVLIALGWAAGKAQTTQSDFELVVKSPSGETTVECRRGCNLVWTERGARPGQEPKTTFTYMCTSATGQCGSGRIGGWITR